MKVFVLCAAFRSESWYELDEGAINEWMEDGSIEDGDLIIYPDKVSIAEVENHRDVKLLVVWKRGQDGKAL